MTTIGRYKVEKELGRGGYGRVYLVSIANGSEKFALKQMSKSKFNTPLLLRCLKSEREVMSSVLHRGVLRLLDEFEDEGNYYHVTPYCSGGDLGRRMSQQGPLGETEVFLYLVQLLNAFKALKDASVVHRDVKPENFLLEGRRVVVGDLGFARRVVDEASTGLGSPGTTAPEVCEGRKYSSAVDVFSLGVSIYTLLTGQPLLPDASFRNLNRLLQQIHARAGAKLPNPEGPQGPAFRPDLHDLLKKMTEVDPLSRPPIEQLFNHPFFLRKLSDTSIQIPPELIEDFTEFRKHLTPQRLNSSTPQQLNSSTPQQLNDSRSLKLLAAERHKISFILKTAKDFEALRRLVAPNLQYKFLEVSLLLVRKAQNLLSLSLKAIEENSMICIGPLSIVPPPEEKTLLKSMEALAKSFETRLRKHFVVLWVFPLQILQTPLSNSKINESLCQFYREQREKIVLDLPRKAGCAPLCSALVDLYFSISAEKITADHTHADGFEWSSLLAKCRNSKLKTKLLEYLFFA